MLLLVSGCLLMLSPFAVASDPAPFVGDYGHGATHDADEVVWRVVESEAGWRLVSTGDGEVVDAHRMGQPGRAAFWNRMGWPVESSHDADCLTWGKKPASLEDLLADTPPAPVAADGDYGLGVLCRVPLDARIQTGWLGDQASDWFYYDPVAGVMEARRLR